MSRHPEKTPLDPSLTDNLPGGETAVLESAEDASLDRRIIVKTDAVVLTLITLVATLEFLDKNVHTITTYSELR